MKNIAMLLTVVLLMVALVFILQSPEEKPYSTNSKIALELYNQGVDASYLMKDDEAISFMLKAVSEDPGFAIAQARLAAMYYRKRDEDSAKQHTAAAESLLAFVDSELERDKIKLVLAQFQQLKASQVDSLLDRIVEQDPDDLQVMITKARVLANRRDPGATDIYKSILEKNSNFAPAYNMLGYFAAHTGNYQEAEDYFRHYSYLVPDIANSHDSLGELLTWTGRYQEAEEEYLKALDIQPDFVHSLVGIATLQIKQGRVKAARKLLNELRIGDTSNRYQAEINGLEVQCCLVNDMEEERLQAIRRMIDSLHSDIEKFPWEAIYYALQGDSVKSDLWLNKFKDEIAGTGYGKFDFVKSGIANLIHQRDAILSEYINDYPSAVKHWKLSVEASSENAPHEKWFQQWKLGEAYLNNNQPGEAAVQAIQILQTNPSLYQAWLLLADASIEIGDLPAARAALNSASPLIEVIDNDLPARSKAIELTKKAALQ
ncbi:MAG: tetratricopeptide repeat protein [bacterium]|nr:tetratricopeptide repeat protein [bacterium]MCP4799751.1 tetratricopeptide repeat protein [bacterium]